MSPTVVFNNNEIKTPEQNTSQQSVLQKYLLPGETTWITVAHRVASAVAAVEKTPELQEQWYQAYYRMIVTMRFMPAGSILANAGNTKSTGGLMNCFVINADDNINSILDAVHDANLTTRYRGGVGINIGSKGQKGYIREKGAPFSDGSALGPCAVLDMISETAKFLTTGNKARRGAFMFSMDWRHPDVWDFIKAKTESRIDGNWAKQMFNEARDADAPDHDYMDCPSLDESNADFHKDLEKRWQQGWVETHLNPTGKRDRRWHNANISVQVDQEFFDLLRDQNPAVGKLWQEIARLAHDTADPGLLFMHHMKGKSPIGKYITCTNPCGEVPLPPDSSCNLGSIVLPAFLSEYNGETIIDWADLEDTVKTAVRFLDSVLTASNFATPGQKENIQNVYRQLGLGILGWSDCLMKLGIPYNSEQHLEAISQWGFFISDRAYRASEQLAEEFGECGIWDQIDQVVTGNVFEMWTNGGAVMNGAQIKRSVLDLSLDITKWKQVPRRNSTVLSIAPTGSISQLAGRQWAFEPPFGMMIWKQVYVDASKSEQNWVKCVTDAVEKLDLSEEDKQIVIQTGSLQGTCFAQENPDAARVYLIANEIHPEWHIKAQAKWQKYLDSSASKTINMPSTTTPEEIQEAYLLAEELGLKGITVYRDATLESEPIKVGDKAKDS